ncbi:MAG: hypothetical protein AB7S74_01880 [Hyphomicrobium sp.]
MMDFFMVFATNEHDFARLVVCRVMSMETGAAVAADDFAFVGALDIATFLCKASDRPSRDAIRVRGCVLRNGFPVDLATTFRMRFLSTASARLLDIAPIPLP